MDKQTEADDLVMLFVFLVGFFFFFSVRFPEDLEDDNTTFNPEYSHQVFGDE